MLLEAILLDKRNNIDSNSFRLICADLQLIRERLLIEGVHINYSMIGTPSQYGVAIIQKFLRSFFQKATVSLIQP